MFLSICKKFLIFLENDYIFLYKIVGTSEDICMYSMSYEMSFIVHSTLYSL